MDGFAVVRLVVGAAFLLLAAVLDVRTRRVRDPVWIALGTLGLGILAVNLALSDSSYGEWIINDWLMLGSGAILFYAVFYGRPILEEDGIYLRPARILILALAAAAFFLALLLPIPPTYHSTPLVQELAPPIPMAALVSVPVLILLYQGFYQVGFLRGGADTKAMIALTLLVPSYPDLSPFPLLQLPSLVRGTLEALFPFSLVVLVNAAILFLVVPIAYVVVNAARRDLELPQALFGTKASLDHLPPHVWLMEHVDRTGERVAVLFPSRSKDESEEIAKLRAAGADRVWVQPKVPFMVPLLIGFLLAVFVGNLMLGFLTAVLPHP